MHCGMQKIGFFAALASAAILHAAAATQAFFPIMAWSGVPDDPAALAKMHDCGITVVGPSPLKYLDACQAAGMKLLIDDPGAKNFSADEPTIEKSAAA